jgi:hypothetical protein
VRVITCAALIMIAVFISFVTSTALKELITAEEAGIGALVNKA